ncbi:Retrovirus-related Pol polyprotein from transposon TNT 1-94 [Araneus ventricosus]|uniref:Retrovirus-related Pol polyprotein from transposon TNT 1-94 n=1 Tax=Araneus ventricosus TaxID=182803 RepID=A0A4Y2DV02_ARAVE|nr:Retrovirus-related Pol polyprotein from transposon TNT 1-94 [Araneus ventricosus]GBM20666.1 Retrovirus-related Pol polyprotein from transposon TNT 1-94 [Araneus ventricosus]GBM20672.1 Retrovirus-related Pol polyprotein from transposon TNT 1-94 [Araneus ventricosus]GBM20713.1 Retrovirus-related Pol polyprotein from transposon TNT 1-94 [Araneus ventricosus]
MKEEIQVIKERKVWDLVPKPANSKVIGCRWVYTLKQDEKGVIVRYKARLVAQGFGQIQGIHYDEIFNPVVNFSIIRMCFSVLVCKQKWRHSQLDIKCAYLYASLQETIFMSQPQGFVDPNKPDHVCHLNKALYGLHQSGREWFYEIHSVLENLSFKKLESTNCVYVYQDNVVLLLYVDDIVLFAKTDTLIKDVIKCLRIHFDLKVLGKTRKLLGVEFEEMGNELFIHQSEYIHKVCEKDQCFNYPVTSLPIAVGIVLSKTQCPSTEVEISEMSKFPYRNLLGCLSFISGRTRPDICYAVNILSQFQSNPGLVHWNILLKLLGYVAQTKTYKLKLSEINNLNINCYSDADFAANRDDRISLEV